MNDRSPSDDDRRRKALPWDWEARRARRRKIAGRAAIGAFGIGVILLLLSAFHIPVF